MVVMAMKSIKKIFFMDVIIVDMAQNYVCLLSMG
jgi:hypothetical protein